MNKKEVHSILLKINKFPCKLPIEEGRILKQDFQQIKKTTPNLTNSKSLRFKYWKEIDDADYFLIEEYLFNDRETVLDIRHAITINYYLNRQADRL
jgi:hypothetical protein